MSVFIKKADKPKDSYNLAVILGSKDTQGAVGIEIEVEGKHLPNQNNTPLPWTYHKDGSLRGHENGEYVLNAPVAFDMVEKHLDTLWARFGELNSVLDESNRTSVHVHLNCQQYHFNRLTSFMAMYFTLEEVLTAWCGDHRVGNLFCLRAKDAPAIISQIRRFIRSEGRSRLSEHLHYAGLNAQALTKFGSLEVRTLRGCTDKQTILNWVRILQRLYDLSAEFEDPREICSLFSQEGPLAFFDSLLGDMAQVVRDGIDYDNDRISDAMYDGIRLAQDLCYCRDWSLFKAAKLHPDPFGRKAKAVAAKLRTAGASAPAWGAYAIDELYSPEPMYDEG